MPHAKTQRRKDFRVFCDRKLGNKVLNPLVIELLHIQVVGFTVGRFPLLIVLEVDEFVRSTICHRAHSLRPVGPTPRREDTDENVPFLTFYESILI